MSLDNIHFNSYTPYSKSEQWCVIEGKNGLLYPGVRIENASFPLTISATQVGIFSCLSEGDTPNSIFIPESFQDERMDYLADYHNLHVRSISELPDLPFFKASFSRSESINDTLENLMSRAIARESNFLVACILELNNGECISGVNIEYPDWQIGLCAERVALGKAIANGLIQHIKLVHITASSGSFISPCGACRQILVEHIPYKTINLHHPEGTTSTTTAAQLLPAFFNGSTLRK